MTALLEVRGLEVSYGRWRALAGVDLVVPEGALVGLLGANGAGKSTLLKAISGLVRPDDGGIFLRGRQIGGLPAHEVADLGVCLIPEGRGVFGALTVDDNLRVALGDDRDAAVRARAAFPVLRDRGRQPAGTLSGGEQQMLALARAVATNPTLLLVDEPSLGLAPKVVREIMDTLQSLHREGRTTLLVEQYATHVLRLADIVYVLQRGQIAWAGEPDELRASDILRESYLGG